MWPLLALILLACPLLLLRLVRKPNQCPNKPPSPPKLPIIGNLHQLDALVHQSLAKLAEKYGPVMLLQFGPEPAIVISSAAAAKEALKTRDADFSGRPPAFCATKMTYNYSDVALVPYSEYWRQMKKITTLELYSSKRVQSFGSVRVDEVNAMLESLAFSAAKGEAVDLGEMMFTLTASIMFKIAFGTSFKGSMMDDKGFEKLIHEAEGLLGTFAAADFFGCVGWVVDKLTGLHLRLDRTFRRLDQFFQHLISEHMKSEKVKGEHEDIVDVLLRVHKEQVQLGATWFTMNNIKGVLLNIFLAGVDTAALTLVWAMTELVKNPDIMKKAQDEIRRVAAGKQRVSEQDLESLKYLKMVLKETLRLHPPAPLLLPKETTTDTKLLGYDIKAGTRVYVNAWAIGRDAKTWEKAEEFSPERFEGGPLDYKERNFELLPFGGGRRMCPGINMGMSTVELTLANMLHCFEWKLPDGMTSEDVSMEEGFGLTMFKKIPLKLVPVNFHL
uniref:Cytochrome P450 n=1 Tax=Kalanchoe fedtschenkoi TaxID=63787 RepID=A0A7N0ZU48_KALFE